MNSNENYKELNNEILLEELLLINQRYYGYFADICIMNIFGLCPKEKGICELSHDIPNNDNTFKMHAYIQNIQCPMVIFLKKFENINSFEKCPFKKCLWCNNNNITEISINNYIDRTHFINQYFNNIQYYNIPDNSYIYSQGTYNLIKFYNVVHINSLDNEFSIILMKGMQIKIMYIGSILFLIFIRNKNL